MADDASLGPRLVVGLTGGIASGKSLVGAMFVKLGAALDRHGRGRPRGRGPRRAGLGAVAAEFGPARAAAVRAS